MSAKDRADLIAKLYKFVKKNYSPVLPPSNRPVLEHIIYGCCLENSTFEAADDLLAKLQENFFDWNEIRVTTVAELSEVAKGVSSARDTAVSLKKTLHGVFETYYEFDIDFLRKENLSKAVQAFQEFKGVSPFVVAYAAQNGLGGHSIPLDKSMLDLFYVLGIISESEMAKGKVPGLERTIAKAKGVDFFVLTHQLAVEFSSSPFKPAIREKLLKINLTAKERFPKRGGKKAPAKTEEAPAKKAPAKTVAEESKAKTSKATKKKAAPAKATKKVVKKKAPAKTTKASKAAPKKKVTKKKATKATKKKAAPKATKKVAKKKVAKKKVAKKKSPTKRLSKKKPR